MLTVSEILKSIQGESTFAGCLCSFVRLTGCNIRCTYCDTTYAYEHGNQMEINKILWLVDDHKTRLVEITGGEPLLQKETPVLCKAFIAAGYTVLVETNGSMDIGTLPAECHRIVDVKCPGSGVCDSFLLSNIDKLTSRDECKFVLSNPGDAQWACDFVVRHRLDTKCTVLFSPVIQQFSPKDLAEWMIEHNAPARLGLQLHKLIWGDKQGV